MRARHPHLVHVAIADFGLSGPRAGWRAEPLPAFAASGALHASGFPDLPPCWLPGYLAHDCASVFAVVGALTAVLERERLGAGQTVEVSVQEAALHGPEPVVDSARRLRANVSAAARVAATQRRRRVPGAPHRRRLRARAARHGATLASVRAAARQP